MNTSPLTGTLTGIGKVPESIQAWFDSARQQAITTRLPQAVLIHAELSIKAHPQYVPFQFSLIHRVHDAIQYGEHVAREQNPITWREQLACMNRPVRTEWYEELD